MKIYIKIYGFNKAVDETLSQYRGRIVNINRKSSFCHYCNGYGRVVNFYWKNIYGITSVIDKFRANT